MDGAMAAYVLLEPTPSAAADAAYWAGIGELATMVVMAAEGGQIVGVSQDALDQVRYTACRGRAAAGGCERPGQRGDWTAAGGASQVVS